MAPFNPSPGPANDPNYLGYSRVGPQPEANTSGKIALTTAGEGISGAVALGDEAIKGGLKDDINTRVDKERDQFTQGLLQVKAQLGNTIPAPNATVSGASTGSWMDSNASADEPELPTGLESGLSRLQQLTLAKQQGSMKLNDTQYAMNTLGIAKQLRTQFPGYRDYIDSEVSKASGLPVANSYYQNLMMDLNRQLAAQGNKKDQLGDVMMRNLDVPHMDSYITQRQSQDPKYPGDAFVLKQVSSWQNLQTQQKIDSAKRAETTADRGTQVDDETKSLTGNLNNLVFHHIQDNLALTGVPTLRDLMTYFDSAKANPGSTTDTEVTMRTQQLQAYRNHIYQEGLKMGSGSATVIGAKPVMDAVNAALAPIDGYIASANDKDTGTAFTHLHMAAAVQADASANWLLSHDTGAIAQQLAGVRGVAGDQMGALIIGPMLSAGLDKSFAGRFNQEAISSIVPPIDSQGKPMTRYMVDAIKDAKTIKDGKGNPAIPPEFNGTVINWINRITDPQMPMAAKDKLIDWGFNPKNIGILDELKMDYRDPNNNQIIPGKYRAYNIMGSDGVVKSVAEASRDHPENYQKFQNWHESSFASLYRQDLQTLDQLTNRPYLGVHFSFNDVSNQFGLVDNNGRPVQRDERKGALVAQFPNQHYINDSLDVLDRLNGGIATLARVQKYNPQGQSSEHGTAAYLLNTVGTLLQGNPNNMAAQAMGRAVIKSKNPDMENDEVTKRLLKVAQPPSVNIP